jgi:hypothetical protein
MAAIATARCSALTVRAPCYWRRLVSTNMNALPTCTTSPLGGSACRLWFRRKSTSRLLGRLQRSMIDALAVEATARLSVCQNCGSRLARKGHHRLVYRSVFGRLPIDSPRLYQCWCSGTGRRSVSPLASCLRDRTSPELQYLEAKFAALMSYGLTVRVLEEVLPLGHVLVATTIRRHVATLRHRIENTDSDAIAVEQRRHINFSAGRCDIPQRNSVRAVGIDGGYIRLAGHIALRTFTSSGTTRSIVCWLFLRGKALRAINQ